MGDGLVTDDKFQKMSGILDVADGGHFEDVPLHRHVELGEVHADLHFGPAEVLVDVSQVDLQEEGSSFTNISTEI